MKSYQLKYSNPNYQNINFSMREGSRLNIVVGVILSILSIVIFLGAALLSVVVFIKGFCSLCHILIWASSSTILTKLARLTQRCFYRDIDRLTSDDRPPILYLRAFSQDIAEDSHRRDKMTPEEILASAFEKIGPLITVGNPKEVRNHLPYLGAIRIYLSEEEWQANVKKLMVISAAVIIDAGCSNSLLWELRTARKLISPDRLFISFLSKYNSKSHEKTYDRFAPEFKKIFKEDIPRYDKNVCFVDFKSYNQPHVICLFRSPYLSRLYNPFFVSERGDHYLPKERVIRELSYIFWKKGLISSKELDM